MSFRNIMDEYIDDCLTEGVLPSAVEVLNEVDVAGQQGGPRDGGNPGKFHAGPPGAGSIATFQDHDAPPRFAGASQRQFTPARFSEQNRAAPPARFGSAARVEAEEEALMNAVFDDLESLDSIEEMSAKEARMYMKKDWEKTKRRNLRRPFKRPMESQEGSDDLGFNQEGVSIADLLDQEIDEAIVARGVGATIRKVPQWVGKATRRAAKSAYKHPVIASVPVSVSGAGAAGYYGAKEKKAARKGDIRGMMKARQKRKVAKAAALAPVAAVSFAAGRGGVRQLSKARAAAKAAKGVRIAKTTSTASKAVKAKAVSKAGKRTRALKDTALGHRMLGGAGVLTGAGAGKLYVGRTGKSWKKGDKKNTGRLKTGRRARSARK